MGPIAGPGRLQRLGLDGCTPPLLSRCPGIYVLVPLGRYRKILVWGKSGIKSVGWWDGLGSFWDDRLVGLGVDLVVTGFVGWLEIFRKSLCCRVKGRLREGGDFGFAPVLTGFRCYQRSRPFASGVLCEGFQ